MRSKIGVVPLSKSEGMKSFRGGGLVLDIPAASRRMHHLPRVSRSSPPAAAIRSVRYIELNAKLLRGETLRLISSLLKTLCACCDTRTHTVNEWKCVRVCCSFFCVFGTPKRKNGIQAIEVYETRSISLSQHVFIAFFCLNFTKERKSLLRFFLYVIFLFFFLSQIGMFIQFSIDHFLFNVSAVKYHL